MYLKLKKLAIQNIQDSDHKLIQSWSRQQSARHRRKKRQLVKHFLAFARKPLADLTVTDIESFVTFLLRRGTHPHQVLQTLAAVKSLLWFGYRIGVLPLNIREDQWPRLRVQKSRNLTQRLLIFTVMIGLGIFLIRFTVFKSELVARKNNISEDSTIFLKLDPEKKANLVNPKVKAFLDTIAWAEGTLGPDGYRIQFTGVKFSSFTDHPRTVICSSSYGRRRCSNAAGRYQFLDTTWDEVAKKLDIGNFSPQSQDLVAIELIKIENALEDIKAGQFETAIEKVANRWASLPGNTYGQPQKSMSELRKFYEKQLDRYQTHPLSKEQI